MSKCTQVYQLSRPARVAETGFLGETRFFVLYIQIADTLGVGLDEALAGRDGIAHQHVEGPVGDSGVFDSWPSVTPAIERPYARTF